MAELIDYAFEEFLARLDKLTVSVPRNAKDLFEVYRHLQVIFYELGQFVEYVEKEENLNEP